MMVTVGQLSTFVCFTSCLSKLFVHTSFSPLIEHGDTLLVKNVKWRQCRPGCHTTTQMSTGGRTTSTKSHPAANIEQPRRRLPLFAAERLNSATLPVRMVLLQTRRLGVNTGLDLRLRLKGLSADDCLDLLNSEGFPVICVALGLQDVGWRGCRTGWMAKRQKVKRK